MKPIENTVKFPWRIGDELLYVGGYDDDDGESLEIDGLYPCPEAHCSHRSCLRMKIVDTAGSSWCSIPEDFEEV